MEKEHFLNLWYERLDKAEAKAEAKIKRARAEARAEANAEVNAKVNAKTNAIAVKLLKKQLPLQEICDVTELTMPAVIQLAKENNIMI